MSVPATFEHLNDEIRSNLRAGFSRLASLPDETAEQIVAHVLVLIDPSEIGPDLEALGERCGLSRETAQNVVSATIFAASSLVLVVPNLTLVDFLKSARNAGLVTKGSEAAIKSFATNHILPVTSRLLDARARAESMDALPSFGGLRGAIDLRLSSPEDDRRLVTPVVLVRLDLTDSPALFFQMTRRDLANAQKGLAAIAKEVDALSHVWSSPLET